MTDLSLTRYDTMRQAIVEAHSIDDVKEIRDKAEALRQYAKQAGESLENQNLIAEIKLRAERRAGELSKELPVAPGARTDVTSGQHVQRLQTKEEVLESVGISTKQANRFEAVASLPEEVFEQHIAETKAAGAELTSAGVQRLAQEHKRETMREQKQEAAPLPNTEYRVWYADPPWQYGNAGVINESDAYGRAARHYPTMSIEELCAMGTEIKARCGDNAVLFMWVTSPLLEECFDVIRAWGFQYKTSFVWDKVKHNFGHYNSVRHEFLLICTRGSCTPDNKQLYDSVLSIEKSDRHSEKPAEFRRIIDDLYRWGDRIELFARAAAEGWDHWGNEA